MNQRGLLLLLTALWVGLEGYPQWQRWLRARAEIAGIHRATLQVEESLKYLPAMRERLSQSQSQQPAASQPLPSGGALQISWKADSLDSPLQPGTPLAGLKLRVSGPSPQLVSWLTDLCRHHPVQKLQLWRNANHVEGSAWVLEIR